MEKEKLISILKEEKEKIEKSLYKANEDWSDLSNWLSRNSDTANMECGEYCGHYGKIHNERDAVIKQVSVYEGQLKLLAEIMKIIDDL